MNTVLIVLVLVALLALVLRQLGANHTRAAAAPWSAPLGADTSADRDGERVHADTDAAATHAAAARPAVRLTRPVRPHRPVGAPRAA